MSLNKTPKNGYVMRPPVPMARQAAALYASTGAATNSCLSSCVAAPGVMYGHPVITPASFGPVSEARVGNYGGLTPEPAGLGPYYDPSSIVTRATAGTTSTLNPADAVDGGLVSVSGLKHGPAPFLVDDGVPVRPKTQYAPIGPATMEPVILDVAGALACRCALLSGSLTGTLTGDGSCTYPTSSMTAVLMTPRNLIHLRDCLEKAGLVLVTPALAAHTKHMAATQPAALRRRGCGCHILANGDLYNAFLAYAATFNNVSVANVPDPATAALQLDTAFVNTLYAKAQYSVTMAARQNYMRAEGPRAYLQPRPYMVGVNEECDEDLIAEGGCANPALPPVLPGTGVRTSPYDTHFQALALTNPVASAWNRNALSCQTGLPIGGAPMWAPATPGVVADVVDSHRGGIPLTRDDTVCTYTPVPPPAFPLPAPAPWYAAAYMTAPALPVAWTTQ